MPMKYRSLTLLISEERHAELRREADRRECSMGAVIRAVLTLYFEQGSRLQGEGVERKAIVLGANGSLHFAP